MYNISKNTLTYDSVECGIDPDQNINKTTWDRHFMSRKFLDQRTANAYLWWIIMVMNNYGYVSSLSSL